ncbi:hypothetical protein QTO34_009578 [Cnephaeus nilssonii]|uniref:Spermatid maturation protein 1 N-terminal domain-containing protein n=1 Tax=Cnephaeus nilssonii TaxID=3371016 RepID=A0AA40LGB4_CNENI|nr:hypothetical protein QTO34_009578 [Eptesicus nilssonii]
MWEQPWPRCASYHSPNTNSCQDLGNSILLLLGLIICMNIGINMVTLLWRRLRFFLHQMFCSIVSEKEASKSSSPRKKTQHPKQSSPAVHLRCTMDPVKMTEKPPHQHTAICSHHWDHPADWDGFQSTQGFWDPWAQDTAGLPAQGIRFQQAVEGRPLKREMRSEMSLEAYVYPVNPPPPAHTPPPIRGPAVVPDIPRRHPSRHLVYDALDTFPRPLGCTAPICLCPGEVWFPLNPCPGILQQRMRNWGHSQGLISISIFAHDWTSPSQRQNPSKVEIKGTLAMQSCRLVKPTSRTQRGWDPGQLAASLHLPVPRAAPHAQAPHQSRGQLPYDPWDQRRRGLEASEPPSALMARSSRPEAREYCSPQSHRRSLPGHAYSRSPYPSTGHLSYTPRDPHEVRRRAAEWAEALPTQHPLTTTTSLTVLGEVSYQRALAPSQPLPEAQTPEPPPTTFMPLSRSPGGNASYQVYDSLELKRQVQENRARANSLPPPSTSASRPSLHRSRTGKLN